jgi:non-heme chloroperoxidase
MRSEARIVSNLLHALLVVTAPPLTATACAHEPVTWHDPSKHSTQIVVVADGVRLEVLDWGGSGRPLVLLAGGGMTAHVFDEFAVKLTDCCHVYGITRRGYGASSQPASGYDDQTLADDVWHVLQSLRIGTPVLVGHSMAGGELTTLGNQHSDRLAGLVYLDALADPRDSTGSDPAFMALYNRRPAAMREPPPSDFSSFAAYRAKQLRDGNGVFPESELRQLFAANPDGTMGGYKTSERVHRLIGEGQKRRTYAGIHVPVLALFDYPRPPDDPHRLSGYQPKNDDERAVIEASIRAEAAYYDRWADNLKRSVPRARLVDLPGAGHFVFLTREPDVLKEIRTFVASLQ